MRYHLHYLMQPCSRLLSFSQLTSLPPLCYNWSQTVNSQSELALSDSWSVTLWHIVAWIKHREKKLLRPQQLLAPSGSCSDRQTCIRQRRDLHHMDPLMVLPVHRDIKVSLNAAADWLVHSYKGQIILVFYVTYVHFWRNTVCVSCHLVDCWNLNLFRPTDGR